MKKMLALTMSVLCLFLVASPLEAASSIAGSKCSKAGTNSISGGKKYTCIKSGGRLIWNKGIPVIMGNPKGAVSAPSPSTTPVNSPAVNIPVSDASAYKSPSECKLTNKSQNMDVNQSHDSRSWKLIDPNKPVRALIFSVDFPDLQSPTTQAPSFTTLMNEFEAFYQSQSNGKMKFIWTVSPKFSRMSKSIASYGVGSRAAGDVWKLNYDIQDLAFQTYKSEDFDFIIGSAPTTTRREDIASSPAFGTNSPQYLPATYLGGDYWSNGSSTTIPTHEFGHFGLGLADLYDFDASMLGQAGFEKQFQYMGVFDIMNWAGGAGLEMTSWNRWIGRLISDKQMLCLPNSTTTTLLKPLEEANNEVKGLVIALTSSSALVIENRAAKGFDKNLPDSAEGILVYTVDTSLATGKGPMRIVRKSGSTDNLFKDATLKNGQSITYQGYSIKVVGAAGDNLYVEVKQAN